MKGLICGASGGLATAVAEALLEIGWELDLVTRRSRAATVRGHFASAISQGKANVLEVEQDYEDFGPAAHYDAHFFFPALFSPSPLIGMDSHGIEEEIRVGLLSPVELTRKLLLASPPAAGQRQDFCYIGSTSAYAGFANTSVYCAVKHGLLGFVRAMNDEYKQSDVRFWLFSMGTMNTEMGAQLVDQDPTSFLDPADVAQRIVQAVTSKSNLFEPEILMRRRTIRMKEKA